MIKCEVVFDGDSMLVNDWYVYSVDIEWNDTGIRWKCFKFGNEQFFGSREQAIKYCMEN